VAKVTRQGRLVVVVSADALDAQRLVEEVPYFDSALTARLLPDWETLPYDILSPHQDLVSQRLEALYRLLNREQTGGVDVLVVPATTALYRLAPPAYVAGHTFFFRQGERLPADALRTQLVLAGYQHVTQVVAPGEFCLRGGLVDLFPWAPRCRSGSICSTRPSSRSAPSIPTRSAACTRCRTYGCCRARVSARRAARVAFRTRWREVFEGDPSRSSVYKDMGNGVASAGIEYYLPLFFDRAATLFDYLECAHDTGVAWHVEAACQRFWTETAERFVSSRAIASVLACRRPSCFCRPRSFL